jgi:hypothetical protein
LRGTVPLFSRFREWPETASNRVIEEGDERFLVKTFDDGSEERQPIVKEPRKKRLRRIDWSRSTAAGSSGVFSDPSVML